MLKKYASYDGELTDLPVDKLAAISQTIYSEAFSWMKSFDKKITEVCSWWFNWQQPSISLDNGLSPSRRQAIFWTKTDSIHWRIYALLEGDGLKLYCKTITLFSVQWIYFMNTIAILLYKNINCKI